MTAGLRTSEQAAHTLQTTTDELAHRRRRGAAPGSIQLTRKTIRYHPADLRADALFARRAERASS